MSQETESCPSQRWRRIGSNFERDANAAPISGTSHVARAVGKRTQPQLRKRGGHVGNDTDALTLTNHGVAESSLTGKEERSSIRTAIAAVFWKFDRTRGLLPLGDAERGDQRQACRVRYAVESPSRISKGRYSLDRDVASQIPSHALRMTRVRNGWRRSKIRLGIGEIEGIS